jgi:hypothetical protein
MKWLYKYSFEVLIFKFWGINFNPMVYFKFSFLFFSKSSHSVFHGSWSLYILNSVCP